MASSDDKQVYGRHTWARFQAAPAVPRSVLWDGVIGRLERRPGRRRRRGRSGTCPGNTCVSRTSFLTPADAPHEATESRDTQNIVYLFVRKRLRVTTKLLTKRDKLRQGIARWVDSG